MINLGQRSEPYEIALPYGLSVTVKPLTTAGMAAAQAAPADGRCRELLFHSVQMEILYISAACA